MNTLKQEVLDTLEIQSLDEESLRKAVAKDMSSEAFSRLMDELCVENRVVIVGKRSDFERDVDPEEDSRVFVKNVF